MSVAPDLGELVAAAAKLRADGTPYVIATVVRVRGSSYRRPGARMIVSEQGRVAGSVSGGCLEGNLVRTALWRTRGGPVIVTFDSSDPDEPEAGLGCGGVVDILLERGGDDDALAIAGRVLAAGERATMITTADGKHVLASAATADAVLVEPIAPPLELFVLGSGLDAAPVADAAVRVGWRVHVWNAGGRPELAQRFPRAAIDGPDLDAVRAQIDRASEAAVLVMGHDARRDRAALAMALASRAAYIGVLGPRHRTLEIAPGVLDDPRVHAPVGLDLGAETPEEIAIAIVAEILAAARQTTAAPLRTRPAIHS